MEHIVSNIKAFRKARGISQSDLAKKTGLNKNSIYNYETNKRQPSIDTLVTIYKALGIKLTFTYECEPISLGLKYETEDKA